MKELAMKLNANLRADDFPPLEFMISLDPDRSFVVREKRGIIFRDAKWSSARRHFPCGINGTRRNNVARD
jgi:hypothetical protein